MKSNHNIIRFVCVSKGTSDSGNDVGKMIWKSWRATQKFHYYYPGDIPGPKQKEIKWVNVTRSLQEDSLESPSALQSQAPILSNATYKRTSPHAFPKKLERKNTEKQSHHYFLYSFEANPWVKFRNRLYPDNWSCSQTCLIGSLANPTK